MLENFRTYEFVCTIRKIIYALFCEYDVTYVRTLSYENFRGVRMTLMMNRPPACHGRTDGQTDGQNYYINIARQQQDADAR